MVKTSKQIEHSTPASVTMHFKHISGSRKRQERKEQEEKVAKLPKLDYFGFLKWHYVGIANR